MSVFSRFGQVVKSEWNARFGEDDERRLREESEAEAEEALRSGDKSASSSSASSSSSATARGGSKAQAAPPRVAVTDVTGALRVLELPGDAHNLPTLDVVREQYRALSQRYWPKTQSDNPDHAHAAHTVQGALTDALYVLEEQLLPLPPSPRAHAEQVR